MTIIWNMLTASIVFITVRQVCLIMTPGLILGMDTEEVLASDGLAGAGEEVGL